MREADYRKFANESDNEYIYRICDLKDVIGTWEDVKDIINEELDNQWTSSAYRKKYQAGKTYMNEMEKIYLNNENIIEQIRLEKEQLNIERKKLQRINQEYQANLRAVSDYELYKELWVNAIENEDPINIICSDMPLQNKNKIGVLSISDQHLGKEVELFGLNGEVVNKYSIEIFEQRMWRLMDSFISDYQNGMEISKLYIFDLGDCIEGILRCDKTLRKLKTGVVESANHYANFMCAWICELYNRTQIPIEYSLCGGNHDILRILGDKKRFDDENIAKDILEKIKDKITINKLRTELSQGITPDITINEYADIIYKKIFDYTVVAYHGDSKNLKEDIEFFENYYKVDIDMLICGHLHRSSQETVGIGSYGDREIIRVPSIIGADDYSKSIRKASRSGALYMIFDEAGKEWSKIYYLQ